MTNTRWMICFLTCAALASCGQETVRTEYIEVKPDVPRELTEPVVVAPREVNGLRDVTLVVVDHAEAVDEANEKLLAIACIVHPEELEDPRSCISDDEGPK